MRKPRPKKPLDPVKQFREFMKNTLRRAFFRYWERTKALQVARVERGLYRCAGCKTVAPIAGHHIDHIDPVVDPKVGFVDWDVYIKRLFCPASNLQLLCKACHMEKTKKEQEERKQAKTGIYKLGRVMPEEQKQKIAQGNKGRHPDNLPGIQKARRRAVVATNKETGEVREFPSITVAATALSVGSGNITSLCKGKYTTDNTKGWTFKYLEAPGPKGEEEMSEIIDTAVNPVEEFKEFQKIPRLSRMVLITEKIDGSNAQIAIDTNGNIRAGSRTRWISPGKLTDNYGFAAWVEANKDELLKLGPGRHFGEWWGRGINRGYGLEEKRFYLFHTHGIAGLPTCVGVVPTLYEGLFTTDAVEETLRHLKESGSVAAPGFMHPEGIVLYHPASGQLFKKTIDNDEQPKGAKSC